MAVALSRTSSEITSPVIDGVPAAVPLIATLNNKVTDARLFDVMSFDMIFP